MKHQNNTKEVIRTDLSFVHRILIVFGETQKVYI